MSRSRLNGASAPTHGFVDQSGSAKSSAPGLHLNPIRCQNMMKSKSNSITQKRVHAQGGVQKRFLGKKYIFEEKAENLFGLEISSIQVSTFPYQLINLTLGHPKLVSCIFKTDQTY